MTDNNLGGTNEDKKQQDYYIKNKKREQSYREKNRIVITSIIASSCLAIIKFVIGFSTNSLGILSEALHSGLDVFAAFMTLYAIRAVIKPPDLKFMVLIFSTLNRSTCTRRTSMTRSTSRAGQARKYSAAAARHPRWKRVKKLVMDIAGRQHQSGEIPIEIWYEVSGLSGLRNRRSMSWTGYTEHVSLCDLTRRQVSGPYHWPQLRPNNGRILRGLPISRRRQVPDR